MREKRTYGQGFPNSCSIIPASRKSQIKDKTIVKSETSKRCSLFLITSPFNNPFPIIKLKEILRKRQIDSEFNLKGSLEFYANYDIVFAKNYYINLLELNKKKKTRTHKYSRKMISLENPIDDKEFFYNYKKGFTLDYLTKRYSSTKKYLIKQIKHFKHIELAHSKVKKSN